MKKKITYSDEPMGELRVVKDFLPPPDRLVLKEDNVKITISLSKSSIDFFKKEAKKQRTSYQKMIRRVIDVYTARYRNAAERQGR
jgi:predicted DNA binding CopG/RHH family protein